MTLTERSELLLQKINRVARQPLLSRATAAADLSREAAELLRDQAQALSVLRDRLAKIELNHDTEY